MSIEYMLQRSPRLVGSRFLASRHMGPWVTRPWPASGRHAPFRRRPRAFATSCVCVCSTTSVGKRERGRLCGTDRWKEEGCPRARGRLMRARETLVRVCPDV